jgi:hypothetical protein
MYDSQPTPYPLGLTDDPAIAALLKRQLIDEAKRNLEAAQGRDTVMTAVFKSKLQQLITSLESLIPDEIELLLLMELRERVDAYLKNGHSQEAPNV